MEDFFARTGVLLRYLPAYSPDLNPIEQAFASTKRFVRENENVYLSTREPTPIIMESFAQISAEQCKFKVISTTVVTFKCNTLYRCLK